jgi:hypothetical protein
VTNTGRRDAGARIEDAVKRMQADPATLWTSLVNELGFGVSNEQSLLLSRLWDILPDKQRPTAIAYAWTGADPPEQILPTDEWLKMFRAVGYIDDAHLGTHIQDGYLGTPPAQITLWRGGVRKTGMSWTADRKRAEWFQHRRYDHVSDWNPGKLWTATISADHVLAHFHVLRPEDEYVVDPAGLHPVEVLEAPE